MREMLGKNIRINEILYFQYGGCTYGLAWCLYSAPVEREG